MLKKAILLETALLETASVILRHKLFAVQVQNSTIDVHMSAMPNFLVYGASLVLTIRPAD